MEQKQYYLVSPLAYTGAASSFTYHYDGILKPGQVVQISIGRRLSLGVVEAKVEQPAFKTKAVIVLPNLPRIPADLHQLARWLVDYYAASPSSVWSAMLPAGLTRKRREQKPRELAPGTGLPQVPLTTEQAAALAQIRTSDQTTHLVQGVTGSGKTRLYLELAAEALAADHSVIILIPEITLTPQIVAQFETAFGNLVLASHSKLTEAKRHLIWSEAAEAAAAGQARVIVGPRSCLFMPAHNLDLVVIDECHETSYKQEQHPRYHAVTTAAKRASLTGARLILGSATPALSELFLARSGRIGHVLLKSRANQIAHSTADIIDLRDKALLKKSKFLSAPLLDAITETLNAGRQSLLYLNRRGSASSQICGDCGHITTCPNCALPLTFHADLMRLLCHHCNYRMASPAVCPECNAANLRLLGGGTKRIEAEIEQLFPQARLARLDRDSATLAHINAVFKALRAGELDIVIGTQMIAKGLDLPAIDTVGIVSADTMLHMPDYTAAERTYQLLSQVSGRAGRGDRAGRVFIQTYTPDHPAIRAAATGDFDGFAAAELAERQLLSYPPYVYMLKLTVALPSREAASKEATRYAAELRRLPGLAVTGPAPAFIEQQAGKFHWIITLKSKRRPPLATIAKSLPSTNWTADLDPVNLL